MVEDLVTAHRWDQRGCGRSTGSGPYTVARFVADLEEIRDHFGHERWIVGGHSWGATLALQYAFAHPERVTALLYLSGTGTGTAWKETYRAECERRLTDEQHRRRRDLENRERSDAEEREYRVLSWAPDYGDRGRAFELAAKEAEEARFPINYECNASLNAETAVADEADLLARCRALDFPVLIVDGAEDPRPAWALDSMVEALPHAERHTLPGVGHMLWVEDPEGLVSVLREFVKRVI
jgi:proline iminopeptidase